MQGLEVHALYGVCSSAVGNSNVFATHNHMVLCMLIINSLFTALKAIRQKIKSPFVVFLAFLFVAGCATDPSMPDQNSKTELEKTEAGNTEESLSKKDDGQPEKSQAQPKTDAVVAASKPETDKGSLPSESEPVVMVPKQVEQPGVTVGPTAKEAPVIPPTNQAEKESMAGTPTSPNYFVITAEQKNSTHPNFGKGHKLGFVVNGKQGQDIVVRRGEAYQLEVKTDPKHDVYISSKAIGWGSSAWTAGVDGAFIYDGVINFKPDQKTPDVLYYSCRNHPYMGGRIIALSEGQTVSSIIAAEPSVTPDASSQISEPIPVTQVNVTATIVNQKLMFADMLAKSSSAQQVQESGLPEAVKKQNQALSLITTSRKQLSEGKNSQALASATQAVDLLKQAKKMVPTQADITQFKVNYADLQESVHNFEASHKKTSDQLRKKEGEKAVVEYDKKKVESLKGSAAQAALKGNYPKAVAELTQAQRIITASIQKMLHTKTIVYDLKFASPQEEYEYELTRFGGYEELIPIAVEAKKPAEGAKQLMKTYLAKGQKLRDLAIKKAAEGDYPTGIAMLLDATKEVRRALRMVGVSQ